MKKIIAVDFDDVVGGFNQAYVNHHNEHYGTTIRFEDVTTYDMPTLYGVDLETILARARRFCHHHHHEIQPIPGVVDALSRLGQRFELHVVTARCESLRSITAQWNAANQIAHFAELHFTNGFGSSSPHKRTKLEVCRQIGAKALVDDSLEHAQSVGNVGIPALLFDKPWNQSPPEPGITRVHSWEEATRWLLRNIG